MVERDNDYEWVPPSKPIPGLSNQSMPKGRQCGQCGMKFDYGTSYGYCCAWTSCPMGWGNSGIKQFTRPGGAF